MRSSSLTTTILNENACANDYLAELSKENGHPDEEQNRLSSLPMIDKFVFKTSKLNPKSSFWTVMDRQADWYKLTIPVNQTSTNPINASSLTVPCRLLPNPIERKKSNSNLNEITEEITSVEVNDQDR